MGTRGGVWFFWLFGGIIASWATDSAVPLLAIFSALCAMEAVFGRFGD